MCMEPVTHLSLVTGSAVSTTIKQMVTAVRCPNNAWLFDMPGHWVYALRAIPERYAHDGMGFVVKCDCRTGLKPCRSKFFLVTTNRIPRAA